MIAGHGKNALGLIAIAVLVASCARMGEPEDVVLVTGDAVSVFATKQQSLAPSPANRFAVLEPDAHVPVLDCFGEGGYSIFKIRLPDGRTGFVSDGDYRLQDRQYSDSAWCGPKPHNPQWQRGWVTNCVGPEFSKFAANSAAGPGPDRPVFKLNHQLALAVPRKYWPNAGSLGHETPTCTSVRDLSTVYSLIFYLQGNWSSGYNQSDVPLIGTTRAAPDWVWVRVEGKEDNVYPEPSGADRQALEEYRRKFMEEDRKRGREVAGLTCSVYCWEDLPAGSDQGSDVVSLKYQVLNPSFVRIYTDYRSHKYGGTHMYWVAVTSDLAHWRAIDDEVWKLIAEWNLLDNAEGAAGQHANGGS